MPPDVEAAFEWYPGFALNVAVLAAEVPGRYPNAHAELEVLTRNGGEVFYVSLDDGDLVSIAQKTVADIGHHFAADIEFDRREPNACRLCYGWCQPTLRARHGCRPGSGDRRR